jgi:hypothetical protein
VFPVRYKLNLYIFLSKEFGKTMTARVQSKKKISGREPQGAWRKDEQIGVKPPVVK